MIKNREILGSFLIAVVSLLLSGCGKQNTATLSDEQLASRDKVPSHGSLNEEEKLAAREMSVLELRGSSGERRAQLIELYGIWAQKRTDVLTEYHALQEKEKNAELTSEEFARTSELLGEYQTLTKRMTSIENELERTGLSGELNKFNISRDKFDNVRIKLFPIENGYGEMPTSDGNRQYFSLYNSVGMEVRVLNRKTGEVQFIGEGRAVRFRFDCPGTRLGCGSNKNRMFIDQELDSREAGREGEIQEVVFDRELLGSDDGDSSIVVTTKFKPSEFLNEDTYRVEAGSKKEETYMSQGITQVRFLGYMDSNRNDRFDTGERSGTFNYYYRDDFEISFGRRFACQRGRVSGETSSEYRSWLRSCKASKTWLGINVVDIERYLYSVVPMEIADVSSISAVEAQSVAARTYIGNKAISARSDEYGNFREWDCEPTIACQAYYGVNKEMKEATIGVHDTAGKILVSERTGNVVMAEFYACRASSRGVSNNPYVEERSHPRRAVSRCSRYSNGGHGRQMSQVAAAVLAAEGFSSGGRPTPGSVFPQDYNNPWSAEDILAYYYPNTRLEIMYEGSQAPTHVLASREERGLTNELNGTRATDIQAPDQE